MIKNKFAKLISFSLYIFGIVILAFPIIANAQQSAQSNTTNTNNSLNNENSVQNTNDSQQLQQRQQIIQDINEQKQQLNQNTLDSIRSNTQNPDLQGQDLSVQITGANQLRRQEIKRIQEEKKQQFDEIRLKYRERKEQAQANYELVTDKENIPNIERYNLRISRIETRLNKVFEHLYFSVEKIMDHLEQQSESGFGTENRDSQVNEILINISNAEMESKELLEKYTKTPDELAMLSAQELLQLNLELTNELVLFVTKLDSIKLDIVNLIKAIK